MMQLKGFYQNYEHFFVTFKRPNSQDLAKTNEVFFVTDPKRNPALFVKNFLESVLVFARERPKFILSTGAGVALPMCFIGKIFGSKIIFVESYCRITVPSLSGRVIYPISDLFIIQWSELRKFYKKAVFVGGFF